MSDYPATSQDNQSGWFEYQSPDYINSFYQTGLFSGNAGPSSVAQPAPPDIQSSLGLKSGYPASAGSQSPPAAATPATPTSATSSAPPPPPVAGPAGLTHYDYWDNYLGVDLSHSSVFNGTDTQKGALIGVSGHDGKKVGKGPKKVYAPDTTSDSLTDSSGIMNGFVKLATQNKQAFAAEQMQLAQAGFYSGKQPVLGSYTEADATAMKSALGSYSDQVMSDPNNPTPMSWADYLDTAAVNGKATGGPQRAPLQLTDPATLQHTLQSAAQNALGRNLSKVELNHFVHAFHGQEQDAYDTSGKGQTYTNPDVAGEAMSFVDSGHAAEERQFAEAGYVDVINKMFGVL